MVYLYYNLVRATLKCGRVRVILSRACSSVNKEGKSDEIYKARRLEFLEQENIRNALVREDLLSHEELLIHRCHNEAVGRGHFTYDDPETNQRQFTRLRHYLRGACCGQACRHCIYDHVKVATGKIKNKRFNSSFWVYNEADSDDINDDYMMSLRKPKLRPNRSSSS